MGRPQNKWINASLYYNDLRNKITGQVNLDELLLDKLWPNIDNLEYGKIEEAIKTRPIFDVNNFD